MADKNIKIQVIDKKATVIGTPVIVCGNSDYTATFTLDDEWSLTGPKTARFVYVKDGKVQHEDVAFSGNVVAVPVLENVDSVDVGVFAGNLCTTTPARVPCRRSILCGSGAKQDPTPDVYDQIMKLFSDLAAAGGFGATEAQARQIEQNKQDIAQLDAAKAEQTGVDSLASRVGQNSQSITKNTQDIAQLEATKAAQTDMAALAARMDTFTKLGEGSTTGDAELADIRAGYDGTQYATAGAAVRGQVNALAAKIEEEAGQLSSEIEELETACVMYATEDWVFGTIKNDSGAKSSADNRLRLEKDIPIDFFEKLTILSGYKFKVFSYDENLVYLGSNGAGFSYTKYEKETILNMFPNTHYIRIIIANNSTSATIDLSMVEESGIKIYMTLGKMVESVHEDTAEKLSLEQYRKEKDYGVVFVAHQGMAYTMPPNTKLSFIEAVKFGCDAIETDVHFTSDNIPVLLHDATINTQARNTDGTEIANDIAIASSTYADLLTYDYGIKYGYAGTKICTFYDYIDFCKIYGIVPYIELKSSMTTSQIEILLSYVEKRGIKNVIWSSTHSQNVKNIDTLRENLTLAYQQTDKRTADDYTSGDYKWFYDMLSKHNCIVRVSKNHADMEYIDSLRELGFLITIGTMDSTSEDLTLSKSVLHGLDYYLHNHVPKNAIFEI